MATLQKCKPCPETTVKCGDTKNNQVIHNITVQCNSPEKKNHRFGLFHKSHNNEHEKSHEKHHHEKKNHHQSEHGHSNMMGQCFGGGFGHNDNKHHASHGSAHSGDKHHASHVSPHSGDGKHHASGGHVSAHSVDGQKHHAAAGHDAANAGHSVAHAGHGAIVCPEKKVEHGGAVICASEKKAGANHGCASNGKGHTYIRTEKRDEYIKCEVQNPGDHCANGQVLSCVKKERVKVKMQAK